MTPEFVLKLGWAAGRALSAERQGLVLIGKDTRLSGYVFESALQAGLASAGMDVRLLGPVHPSRSLPDAHTERGGGCGNQCVAQSLLRQWD